MAACVYRPVDQRRRGQEDRRETTGDAAATMQSGCWTTWASGTVVDDGRLAHNPEVAGSNPAPATNFRRSKPFPIRKRVFCVPGTVVKPVVGAGLRAARQRDGRDRLALSETARNPVDNISPGSLGAWPRGTAGPAPGLVLLTADWQKMPHCGTAVPMRCVF